MRRELKGIPFSLRWAHGCRRTFPDEEGTKGDQGHNALLRRQQGVEEHFPMRRELKDWQILCPSGRSSVGRRTFPDEEGTEDVTAPVRDSNASHCRRTFPDEEGTERLASAGGTSIAAANVAEHFPMRGELKAKKNKVGVSIG